MKSRLQELYENKKYFEILEIEPTQNLALINKALRMTALKYHPEKGGSHDEMVIIVDIMQKLRDKNYLQLYLRYLDTGEDFNENNFQFETDFPTVNSEYLRHYIRSRSESIKQVYYNLIESIDSPLIASLDNLLIESISSPLSSPLIEFIDSPFEVSFHYKDGEIRLVIREELDDGKYQEKHFQHTITDKEFIIKAEHRAHFFANPEDLQKKVGKLIQNINRNTIKRPIEEIFDKLNNWMEQLGVEYRKRAQTGIELGYDENTKQDRSQKWLNQITKHEIIKQDSGGSLRRLATGAMLYFFGSVSSPSPSVTTLPPPEYHREHFEVDYYLLGLLAVASFTIATVLLYCICQPRKAIDSDNSCERSERKFPRA